ncbi:MAG: hypothetical protein U5L45_03080 [Saprospiraceae bacterium]|nr:hypothetical protein [Saprospiraceae bacterium]
MVHFSGKARKMNHIPLSRERSERENQQFRFYVWVQNFSYEKPSQKLFLKYFEKFLLDIDKIMLFFIFGIVFGNFKMCVSFG